MKLAVVTVVLALAVATVCGATSPVLGYHTKIGIPRATAIKQQEQQAASRIVNGEVTDISNTPYQFGLIIQILVIFNSVCGASMISSTRAVTAAHCYSDGFLTAQSMTIVMGSNTLFSGGTRVTTTDIAVHPGWNPITAENDVAVLRFNAVGYTNTIQPIALASSDEDWTGQTALASGYGHTVDGGSIGTNQVLSSVSLRIISNDECRSVYGSYVHDSNICTSGEGGRGTCQGDSGGPLALISNSGALLLGVTSFGAEAGCAAGFPAAYARVSHYADWVNEQ